MALEVGGSSPLGHPTNPTRWPNWSIESTSRSVSPASPTAAMAPVEWPSPTGRARVSAICSLRRGGREAPGGAPFTWAATASKARSTLAGQLGRLRTARPVGRQLGVEGQEGLAAAADGGHEAEHRLPAYPGPGFRFTQPAGHRRLGVAAGQAGIEAGLLQHPPIGLCPVGPGPEHAGRVAPLGLGQAGADLSLGMG